MNRKIIINNVKYINKILKLDTKHNFTHINDLFIPKLGIDNLSILKQSNINFFNYFLKINYNFCKILIYSIFKNKKCLLPNQILKKKYKNIFFCHLNDDTKIHDLISNNHFGKIIQHSKKNADTLRIFLDHRDNKKLIRESIKDTIIINSNIKTFICVKNSIKLLISFLKLNNFFKKNKLLNYDINKLIKISALSTPSLFNLNLLYELKTIFQKFSPSNIFFTFEGHGYERIILIASSKINPNIKTYAYPHGTITKSQNNIFLKLGKQIMPKYILCPGNITYKYFLKRNFNDLIIIGSNRHNLSTKLRLNRNNNLLIMPDGTLSETYLLLDIAFNLSIKFFDRKIYFKLHPFFNRKLLRLNNYQRNNLIIFQFESIEYCSRLCNKVLYKGTAAVLECISYGMIPIYFNYPRFPSKNILFSFNNHINKSKIYKIDKFNINISELDKIKKYADNYYTKELRYVDLKKLNII